MNSRVDENFKKWALGFSGIDGGDAGSPENPSVWLCGLEWGDSGDIEFDKDRLQEWFNEDVTSLDFGYDDERENLEYSFNRNAMKILTALNGDNVENYEDFALKNRPFCQNSKGYFKLNLYPLKFKNTDNSNWNEEFAKATGLKTKDEYIEFIRNERFPVLQNLVKTHRPKLVICVGNSYKDDFIKAFGGENAQIKETHANDKIIYYFTNAYGTKVAITYFISGRGKLKSDEDFQKTGEALAKILEEK